MIEVAAKIKTTAIHFKEGMNSDEFISQIPFKDDDFVKMIVLEREHRKDQDMNPYVKNTITLHLDDITTVYLPEGYYLIVYRNSENNKIFNMESLCEDLFDKRFATKGESND